MFQGERGFRGERGPAGPTVSTLRIYFSLFVIIRLFLNCVVGSLREDTVSKVHR